MRVKKPIHIPRVERFGREVAEFIVVDVVVPTHAAPIPSLAIEQAYLIITDGRLIHESCLQFGSG